MNKLDSQLKELYGADVLDALFRLNKMQTKYNLNNITVKYGENKYGYIT